MADQVPSSSAPSAPAKPRRKRRWLRWIGGLFLLLILLVLLLPTIISLGIANGYIRSAINHSINGTVTIKKVNLAWFGQQSVQGFELVDAQGNKAANVDVTIDSSLLKLITSRTAPVQITLSGEVSGKTRKDG